MCTSCVSRRSLLAAAVVPFCPGASLVEPRMALAAPAVALTLDACMGGVDRRILDVLLARRIPATLFVTGRWLRANPETVAVLRANPGQFSLQDHGARHVPAVLGALRPYGLRVAGSMDAVRAEVLGGADSVAATGATRPTWYRGATALYSPEAIPAIEGWGFAIAGFSLNADDGASLPAAAVARRVAAARPGDVVIGHINHPERSAGAGLAEGIAMLADRGMRFATLEGAQVNPLPCVTR